MVFDCVIVGGGIAGLQASIQLGRYNRSVLIIDSLDGRSSICKNYNNILGFPDGISGAELRNSGLVQAKRLGVQLEYGKVTRIHKNEGEFSVETSGGQRFQGKTLLLATGVKDNIPDLPGIEPCLGLSVFVCPDCDGYEITDQKTIVMGAGDVGASMALTLNYWTKEILFLNHEGKEISDHLKDTLSNHQISFESVKLKRINHNDGIFQSVETDDARTFTGDKGFVAFGGNEVRSDLAVQLGADVLENHHLVVDPKTKMTNVEHLWAAGDAVAHSELVTAAMGEGAVAAIWIQKALLDMLKSQ